MFPFLRLGPFLLQLPGLALLAGVWVSSSLAEKEASRLKLPTTQVNNLIFLGLAAGVIGARLAYAARYLSIYLDHPASLFAINGNTLAVFDGLAIGLAAALLYGRRKKLPFRPTLDALAPGLAAFMVFIGVAHFLNGAAFGAPANFPWSIYLWNEYRHPSQVYEIMAALGILFILHRRLFNPTGSGINFLLVVALSAAVRIFLEAFRGDSSIWPGGFRSVQIIGLFILAFTVYLMGRWGKSI